jgi:peptide/nickel transport system substrate-binding protein
VDLTMGRGLSIEQAAQLREQWTEGTMQVGALGNWIGIYPQYINPSPQAFLNPQFRRAVAYAIDRQQMADTLVAGFGAIAHSIISEKESQYPAIERQIVRYEYDPQRAAQMVEALGYVKAADGILHDAAGRPLHFQVQSNNGPAQERALFATFEFLQRLGLSLETDFIPPQAGSDRARRAERSGFEIQRQTNGVQNLYRFHSKETPLRENNFVGDNRSRYQHPDLDAALDRYFTSVPQAEQMQALGDVIHHMTDQLNIIGLILDGDPTLMSNRMRNVGIPQVGRAFVTANAYEWDVAG